MKYILNVVPKPRPEPSIRIIKKGKRSIPMYYYKEDYRNYKKELIETIRNEFDEIEKGHDMYCVSIRLFLPFPESIVKKNEKITLRKSKARKTPKGFRKIYPDGDLDNYSKAILDCITQSDMAWEDDVQVIGLAAQKAYDEVPRIELDIDWAELSDVKIVDKRKTQSFHNVKLKYSKNGVRFSRGRNESIKVRKTR